MCPQKARISLCCAVDRESETVHYNYCLKSMKTKWWGIIITSFVATGMVSEISSINVWQTNKIHLSLIFRPSFFKCTISHFLIPVFSAWHIVCVLCVLSAVSAGVCCLSDIISAFEHGDVSLFESSAIENWLHYHYLQALYPRNNQQIINSDSDLFSIIRQKQKN